MLDGVDEMFLCGSSMKGATLSYASKSIRSCMLQKDYIRIPQFAQRPDEVAYVALRPIGLTLIIPLRNSINVPLYIPTPEKSKSVSNPGTSEYYQTGKATITRRSKEERRGDRPFYWDVQIGDVVQDKVGELLVLLLSQPADEGLLRKLFAKLVRCEAVLGEEVVEIISGLENMITSSMNVAFVVELWTAHQWSPQRLAVRRS